MCWQSGIRPSKSNSAALSIEPSSADEGPELPPYCCACHFHLPNADSRRQVDSPTSTERGGAWTARRSPGFSLLERKGNCNEPNIVSLVPTDAQIKAATDALIALEGALGGLISLDAEGRRRLPKMDQKWELFCRQAISVLALNPQIAGWSGIVPLHLRHEITFDNQARRSRVPCGAYAAAYPERRRDIVFPISWEEDDGYPVRKCSAHADRTGGPARCPGVGGLHHHVAHRVVVAKEVKLSELVNSRVEFTGVVQGPGELGDFITISGNRVYLDNRCRSAIATASAAVSGRLRHSCPPTAARCSKVEKTPTCRSTTGSKTER